MHSVSDLRYLFCAALLLLACSGKEDSPSAGSGGGAGNTGGSGGMAGTSATGGTGGTGGTGFIDGPAITSAPDEWAPPADCGGVGEMCEGLLSCGERAICQSIGNVCIPAFEGGSLPDKSEEYPYCAAFTCMSFEEASCFCTGPAAETVGDCSSPEALAGLCEGQGGDCSETACCDELSCEDAGNGLRLCVQPCTEASECETGCCIDALDIGKATCSLQLACDNPCKHEGEDCPLDGMGGGCCRGACIESPNADFDGCRPTCIADDECDSGCCKPTTDGSLSYCAPAQYCGCVATDDHCGSDTAVCCEGNECVGASAETLTCHQVCTDNADCATNCCDIVTGADYKVCQGPEYCQ